MQRDSIDFGTMNIPMLFRKMFFPTLLGMLLSATINVADGAFVGHGAGSDALAAVNIVVPFFFFTTGIGLMFGSGASIVASLGTAISQLISLSIWSISATCKVRKTFARRTFICFFGASSLLYPPL